MKEIEILVEVYDDFEKVNEILKNFEFVGIKETFDEYFYDPLRDSLKPNKDLRLKECFRLRKKDGIVYITYKVDNFNENDIWLYSDEYETKIDDFETAKKIILNLGLEPLIVINSKKYTYISDKYEIVLEKVENLGVFMEIELKEEKNNIEIVYEKNKIQEFINSLGINVSSELNMGKPEMMLKKQVAK